VAPPDAARSAGSDRAASGARSVTPTLPTNPPEVSMLGTSVFQALTPDHHRGGLYLGLHWAWWVLWLGIGAALIWGLARVLRQSR